MYFDICWLINFNGKKPKGIFVIATKLRVFSSKIALNFDFFKIAL